MFSMHGNFNSTHMKTCFGAVMSLVLLLYHHQCVTQFKIFLKVQKVFLIVDYHKIYHKVLLNSVYFCKGKGFRHCLLS